MKNVIIVILCFWSYFVQARIAYTQPGVYIFKYSINGIEIKTGKLILE